MVLYASRDITHLVAFVMQASVNTKAVLTDPFGVLQLWDILRWAVREQFMAPVLDVYDK